MQVEESILSWASFSLQAISHHWMVNLITFQIGSFSSDLKTKSQKTIAEQNCNSLRGLDCQRGLRLAGRRKEGDILALIGYTYSLFWRVVSSRLWKHTNFQLMIQCSSTRHQFRIWVTPECFFRKMDVMRMIKKHLTSRTIMNKRIDVIFSAEAA